MIVRTGAQKTGGARKVEVAARQFRHFAARFHFGERRAQTQIGLIAQRLADVVEEFGGRVDANRFAHRGAVGGS